MKTRQRRALPWFPLGAAVCCAGLLLACNADTVDLAGLPCDAGACAKGFVCHPETNLCVTELDCATCTPYYRDNDGDGSGQDGDTLCLCAPEDPYDATVGGDCDDAPNTGAGCATGCTTYFADTDNDALGDANTSVEACAAPTGFVADATDCNDGNGNCGADCTDGDSDGYCLGVDCYDGSAACTDDCSACAPTTLSLSVSTPAPINPGETVDLVIDLGGYLRDATSELSCSAPPQTVFGPLSFTGQPSLASLGLAETWGEYRAEPADAPFDVAACSGAGDFVAIISTRNNARLELASALDLVDYSNLSLEFIAAAEAGFVSGDNLVVRSCCGNACALSDRQTVTAAEIGSGNACSAQQISLPHDACANLELQLMWDQRSVDVGIDDVAINGALAIASPTNNGDGTYAASFTAGQVGSLDVTCTWSNSAIGPDVSDVVAVTVE